jgi:class 3 adenylate cyclase/tetratricopeptide (TPR) repeat protein
MELPSRFGRYELLRRLAKGGMAELFLARSFGVEGFEKHLVIKRILPDLAESPRFVNLFIKEARISASLVHPNIVQVYELGRVGQDHFIAMEYIHGRDLTRINRALRGSGERLPLPFAVTTVASILRGLAYAHARADGQGQPMHIIHRDVSPHNVMVSFLGEVKLFDFGIARLRGEAESTEGLPGGGKYAYMSPEQATGRPLDHRTDIYSAGIVLYELLVGHRLFQDPDPAEKLRKVRAAIVPDPREENPDIPDELWDILRAMLSLDPADRPGRAERAEEELWAFLYRHGLRADAHELSAYMRGRFPDEADADPVAADLEGLAADLRRLADRGTDGSGVTGSVTRTETPVSGVKLPRLLRGLSGERKQVVVLVGEVLGFTDLSAKRDATVVVRRHYQLLRRIRRVVDRHGGFLERYQDDRFVVFFGVPRAGEHDLARGLACAGGLLDVVARVRVAGMSVDMSLGIHRGEITVGSRSGRSIRYLARGDTMKRAHRLCGEADVGQILVSERVAAMSGGRFRFIRGPSYRLKGDSTVNKSFVLQGTRDVLPATRGRWVSRSGEINLLGSAIDSVKDGQGGVVAIVGRAGMGKTRLMRELRDMARAAHLPTIIADARPFRGDRPFDVLRAVVAHLIGIDREADADTAGAHIGGLIRYGINERDVEVIGAMFGIPIRSSTPLDVGAMKGAASRLLAGLGSEGPALMITDDTQHIGALELEIIGTAIRALDAATLLFVFASRDGLPKELRPASVEVELTRMTSDTTVSLIAELLGVEQVGAELVDLVDRTAEGNPLYMDEITRSLRREGRVRIEEQTAELDATSGGVHLPPSLGALISARIDALGPACKGVLQIGATIGMSFPSTLAREASGLDDIGPLLADLVDRGIILQDTEDRSGRCAFSSVFIWEVVHRSIMGVRLKEYHRMVAIAMERVYGDELDGQRMQLAGHCAAGGRLLDAAQLSENAGIRLQEQQLIAPALQCWEQGIAWLDRVEQHGHAARSCEALLRLRAGRGWSLMGELKKAEVHLQVAQDLAADLADSELEARATLALGRLYRSMGRPILARASLESAQSTAMDGISSPSVNELPFWRREVAVDALSDLGTMALDAGDTGRAEEILDEARRLAGNEDKLAARTLIALASRRIWSEDHEAAIALLEEARERAQVGGDRIMLGTIENNIGIVHHGAGRFEDALKHFRDALTIRQGLGYRMGAVINLHNIGDSHFRLDDPSRAWAAFRQSRELADRIDWEPGVMMNEVFLAYLESSQDPDVAEARLNTALHAADDQMNHDTRIAARWLLGRVRWDRGDREGANAAWEDGMALSRELDAPKLARDIREELRRAAEADADGEADANGSADGNANGSADGNANGSADGSADGNANGSADGNANGSADGNANGSADGNANGSADGNANGSA